jgi:hypothetical protein
MVKAKKKVKSNTVNLRQMLSTWRTVIESITKLSEEEAAQAIEFEQNGAKRRDIIMRLYGRYNRMRTERELRELLEE